jgi:hypothetical protein
MPSLLKTNQSWARNKQLADYLGVTTMALYRWKQNEALHCPQSCEINGLEYNSIPEWDAWLRARAISGAGASARPRRVQRFKGKHLGKA